VLRNEIDTLAVRHIQQPPQNKVTGLSGFYGEYILYDGWAFKMNQNFELPEEPLDIWIRSMGEFINMNGNENCYYSGYNFN
jgi:hypothetical protein